MRFALLAAIGLLGAPPRGMAQSEESLRRFFEGKSVIVKVEMPGTDDGIDVYPGTSQPVDFPRVAKRLEQYGTSIRRGQEMLFSDPAAKKKAQEELDALRKDRARTDAANRAAVAQAQQMKDANVRSRRSESGSRFNLRFKPVVPDEAMTPDGVMRALAEYVDFSLVLASKPERPGLHGEGAAPVGGLRKGMLVEEVDALLGRPESIATRAEGTLRVSSSVYLSKDRRFEVEFVEGVLIRFTVASR